MPAGKHKSRSLRRVAVKAPGGRVRIHYRERKPAQAKCSSCGAVLGGVPRERPYKMKTLPKTKKRPERPYGGFICHKCLRNKIIEEARR